MRPRSAQHGITKTSGRGASPKSWPRVRLVRTTIPSARRSAARSTALVSRHGTPPCFQRPASTYSSAISPRMSKISLDGLRATQRHRGGHVRARVDHVESQPAHEPCDRRGAGERVEDRRRQRRPLVVAQPMPRDAGSRHLPAQLRPALAGEWLNLEGEEMDVVTGVGEAGEIGDHLGMRERVVERQVTDVERAHQRLADRKAATIFSSLACSV